MATVVTSVTWSYFTVLLDTFRPLGYLPEKTEEGE